MKLFSKIKANHALKHPDPEPKPFLHEDLPKKLRQNAQGLERVYGDTQFIERIRRAADRLETLEMTIALVAQTTQDPATKTLVQDVMDKWV
jgi:hypothetical protein